MAQQSAKEKAKELVDKFYEYNYRVKWDIDTYKWEHNFDQSKQCALVAVDEIIYNIEPSVSMDVISARIKYWEQVKQEIEKQ
jgi:hypothetical protein